MQVLPFLAQTRERRWTCEYGVYGEERSHPFSLFSPQPVS